VSVDGGVSVTTADDESDSPPLLLQAATGSATTTAIARIATRSEPRRVGTFVSLVNDLRCVDVGDVSLTPTSYLVLGLVGHAGRCTSYEMKTLVAGSIGYFWSFPHSQLYAEPMRLVALGLLAEETETTGRRRRTYTLTPRGRDALRDWLDRPIATSTEIRDLAMLKLFFGSQTLPGSVHALAEAQLVGHRARLAEYESIQRQAAPGDSGEDHYQLLSLSMGVRFERMSIDFWEHVAGLDGPSGNMTVPVTVDDAVDRGELGV
jgi:DNA-binding PadR family transcriptional regulator